MESPEPKPSPSEKPLFGKAAIVTGSSRGIGQAIAFRLAQDGASVMLTARDSSKLAGNARKIIQQGGVAEWFASDLQAPDAPQNIVQRTVDSFGGIDIVVNNAGSTKRGDFIDLTDEDWDDGFGLKFFGAVRLIRAAWPQLEKRHGSILNIAGVGGRTPGPQFAIGGSVNAALLSLTKALADAGILNGVQVNAINPGPVRTDRFRARMQSESTNHGIDPVAAEKRMVVAERLRRIGEPEDIAALVAFIVSPEGSFLHGALIDADGGQTKTI